MYFRFHTFVQFKQFIIRLDK